MQHSCLDGHRCLHSSVICHNTSKIHTNVLLKTNCVSTLTLQVCQFKYISDKNRFPKKNAQLFLSKEREDIPFTKMNYTPDLEKYNNKIISCSYKGNQWHFHRLRDDRPFPNARKTADSVLNAMKRPVTREVLCDLIKNQLK